MNPVRLFAIFALFTLGMTSARAEAPGMVHLTSPHGFPVLVKRLDAAVRAHKMAVVTRASASVGAKRLGKTIAGNMVVGVFHPRFAVRMLAASIPAGYEAPIRFYVTETSNGTASLSYRKPSALFAPYKDGGAPLATMAAELDAIFARIAADAVK